MKKHILLLGIIATGLASWLLASPVEESLLKDFGRIASFSTHAKMIKTGETEKAVRSLEGLMEQGYLEMREKYPDTEGLRATKRAIMDYYTSTGQATPSYLK